MYSNESQVRIAKLCLCIHVTLKIGFTLTNGAGSDEAPPLAALVSFGSSLIAKVGIKEPV